MGYQSKIDYANYMNNGHGLLVPELDPRETSPSTTILSSVKVRINYYELEPQVIDLDIVEYLFRKWSEIDDVIRKHTNQFQQKMQLMVKMTLQKPTDEDPEKINVIFNTHTTTIYYTGVSVTTYEDLKLVSFSIYGSGWQLQTKEKVTIKLVGYVLIRGSSFIFFSEGQLLRGDSNIINIHNSNDEKCFLYCFTTGYYLVHKNEKLEPTRPCFRPRTNILTDSSENHSAKQPRLRYANESYGYFEVRGLE